MQFELCQASVVVDGLDDYYMGQSCDPRFDSYPTLGLPSREQRPPSYDAF